MIVGSVVAGSVAAVLSLFKWRRGTKSGPCASAAGAETPFVLPKADFTCPTVVPNYQLLYFSPANDPLANNNFSFTGPNGASQYFLPPKNLIKPADPNVPSFSFTFGGLKQTQYTTMQPTSNSKITASNVDLFVDKAVSLNVVNPGPLNVCPQAFKVNAETNVASQFAAAVPLPSTQAAGLDPMLWVIPGLADVAVGGNGINVPSLTSAPSVTNGFTAVSAPGLASTLYIVIKKATTLFIEIGGAAGGDVPIYTSGIDPVTHLPRTTAGYVGGFPGIVYGLYSVQANDVLKVFLGSKGDEILNTTGLTTFDGNGQGGLGTVFGGANGGGASYVAHYKSSAFGLSSEEAGTFSLTLEAAINSDPRFTLVCVAGAGGGASRNASGGSAGFSNGWSSSSFAYGFENGTTTEGLQKSFDLANANGSAGGLSFITGTAPFSQNINANGFSGGGGVQNRGGISVVPNQVPNDTSSWGHVLQPFVDTGLNGCHGGGSVSTDVGSGGGGGGGGAAGGGAGAWNGLPKPNNVHGAGGGGSSTFGLLRKATNSGAKDGKQGPVGPFGATLNAYRSSNIKWPVSSYGYLVLGCSKVPE